MAQTVSFFIYGSLQQKSSGPIASDAAANFGTAPV